MAIIQPSVAGFPGIRGSSVGIAGRRLLSGAGKLITPPVVAGGGGTSDVARAFSAAGLNKVVFGSGAFAGATFDYGTIAAVVSHTDAGTWQDIVSLRSSAGTGETGVLEISDFDQWWFSISDINGVNGPVVGTGNYCVVVTKASGSAIPRWHVYNYGTSSWAHSDANAALANGTANITSIVVGEYPGGFDYNNSKISTVGVYRHWVPNDADVVAANLHLDLDNFVAAFTNSDLEWLVAFNQASTATTVLDLSTGGGNQTAITGTTVSTGPAAYDNSTGGGGADTTATVPAVLASPSTFGTPTVQATGNAVPGTLICASTFPTPTARASGVAGATILASPSAFPSASGQATGNAAVGLLASPSSFPTPSAQASGVAAAPLLSSPSSFPAATGRATGVAVPTLLVSASSFGLPTISVTGLSDDFTGTNGDDWDPVKWFPVQGNLTGSNSDIENNQGRQQTTTGNYAGLTRRSRVAIGDDFDALGKITFPGTSEWYAGFWLKASNFTIASNTQPADGYIVEPSLNYISIDRVIGGTRSSITGADLSGYNFWSGTWWIKAQISGTTLRLKVWLDGTSEPDGWDINVVDGVPVTTPGQAGVYHYSGAAVETIKTLWDSFSVRTGSPLSFDISGTPAVLVSSSTFGTATAVATGVGTPSLLASPSSFPVPTPVASGNAVPGLLASPSSFPAPTARATGVAQPGALQTPSTFPTPTPTATGVATPALLQSPSTFPAATGRATGVAVATLLSSVSSFGTATGQASGVASLSTLVSPSSFSTPGVSATGIAVVSTLQSPSSFGLAVGSSAGPGTATPAVLNSPSTFGAVTVSATGRATTTLLLSPSIFGTATGATTITAVASTLVSVSAFGVPTVRTTGSATPTTLLSVSTFLTPVGVGDNAAHPVWSSDVPVISNRGHPPVIARDSNAVDVGSGKQTAPPLASIGTVGFP